MYSNRVPRELSQETRHCLTPQPSLSATWGFMTGCLYDNKQADRHTFSLWYGGLLLLCMGCCPARFFSYGVLPFSPRPPPWVSRWMRIQGSGVLLSSPRPSPWVSRWMRIQGSGVLPSSPRPPPRGMMLWVMPVAWRRFGHPSCHPAGSHLQSLHPSHLESSPRKRFSMR